jgi:hypothetical protein
VRAVYATLCYSPKTGQGNLVVKWPAKPEKGGREMGATNKNHDAVFKARAAMNDKVK